MKIKIGSILFLLFLFFTLSSQAQRRQSEFEKNNDRKENKQKIKALYTVYMTQELKLDEGDAQKFWPVQQQYSSEIKSIMKQPQISELESEEATLNVRKKYNEKFSKILGKERTNLFFKKDKEFRNKLVIGLKKKKLEEQKNHGKKEWE